MKLCVFISLGILAVAVAFTAFTAGGSTIYATAQQPPHQEKKVEMLFVQSAKGASLVNGKLTLKSISPTTLFFSDRPDRIAGHVATDEMISLWSEGKDSFMKDPPNATLSTFASDGKVANIVVELRNPGLTGNQMTYDVRVLQGKLPENIDAASLFIDVIGMPLTPVSYAGAARRTTRRAVVY